MTNSESNSASKPTADPGDQRLDPASTHVAQQRTDATLDASVPKASAPEPHGTPQVPMHPVVGQAPQPGERPGVGPAMHPAQAAAPMTPPNIFVTAFMSQLPVISNSVRGYPARAFGIATQTPKYWLATMLTFVVTLAMYYSMSLNRGVAEAFNTVSNAVSSFGGSGYRSDEYGVMSFGEWLQTLIIIIVLSGIAITIRALAVMATFASCGRRQSFVTSISLVLASINYMAPIFMAGFTLLLLPGSGTVSAVSFIFGILVLLAVYASDLMLYVGLNRTVRFEKSPLIPHVLYTLLYWIVSVLCMIIFYAAIIDNLK